MERLKHKVYELLDQAVNWWGRQEVTMRWRGYDN